MESISEEKLISKLEAYKKYLESQGHEENGPFYRDVEEDYKRNIAEKAAEALDSDNWTEENIGTGTIRDHAIKAVQRHINLIGRFQVSSFSDKVKGNTSAAERILFDLYHEHKDQECFELLCTLLGKKYDLMSYLYFIRDPSKYLPVRSSIFDKVFKKYEIDLQTNGRCSWDNYQKFIGVVTQVRDLMRDYYNDVNIDLLDAHSFLWTLNSEDFSQGEKVSSEGTIIDEQKAEVDARVFHKVYGDGIVTEIAGGKIYIEFENEQNRIFDYPAAFEKGYLKL